MNPLLRNCFSVLIEPLLGLLFEMRTGCSTNATTFSTQNFITNLSQ
jgi:hypothetical protein